MLGFLLITSTGYKTYRTYTAVNLMVPPLAGSLMVPDLLCILQQYQNILTYEQSCNTRTSVSICNCNYKCNTICITCSVLNKSI